MSLVAGARSEHKSRRAPATLGTALRRHREASGLALATIAARCDVSVDLVRAIEDDGHDAPHRDLSDELLAAVVAAYGVDRCQLPAEHTLVVVDIVHGELSARPSELRRPEAPVDAVLLTYLCLLLDAVMVQQGKAVTISDIDVWVVHRALARRNTAEVPHVPADSRPRVETTGRIGQSRPWWTAAAAVVCVAIALVLAASTQPAAAPTIPAPATVPAPATAPAPATPAPATPAPAAPVGEIGGALVIERER